MVLERVEFLVNGRQGDRYTVAFEVNGTRASAFCTCQAGANGQLCKHRMGIMDGDVFNLLGGNMTDVVHLKALLKGTDLEATYSHFLKAEAVCAAAKKELDAAKKALAKVMRQ